MSNVDATTESKARRRAWVITTLLNGYIPYTHLPASVRKEYIDDEEVALAALVSEGECTYRLGDHASEALRNNRKVVMASVARIAGSYRHASTNLQRDTEVALRAIKTDPQHCFHIIDPTLRTNVAFVTSVAPFAKGVLRATSPEIQGMVSVVRAVVAHDGYELKSSPMFLCNKEIALLAVRNTPLIFQRLSVELRDDEDVVMAWASHGRAMPDGRRTGGGGGGCRPSDAPFLGQRFLCEKPLALKLLTQLGWLLQHMSQELKSDYEAVSLATTNEPYAMQWAADELKTSPELVRRAVGRMGHALTMVHDSFISTKEYVILALKAPVPIQFFRLPTHMQRDHDVRMHAVKNFGGNMSQIELTIRANRCGTERLESLVALEMVNAQHRNLTEATKCVRDFYKRGAAVWQQHEAVIGLAVELLACPRFAKAADTKGYKKLSALVEKLNREFYSPTGAGGKRDRDTFASEFTVAPPSAGSGNESTD